MDFYRIVERSAKNGVIEIYPDFQVCRSQDLMIRGKSFYAIWDEDRGFWSTDEYDVQRLVDKDLRAYKEKLEKATDSVIRAKYMSDFSTNMWLEFRSYMNHLSDSSKQLDEDLTFSSTEVKKTDYRSKRLDYPLEEGPITAYDELMSTLYDKEEREKLEWAIGAIVSGDAKNIQKFIVLYGEAGAGKSTVLNIIQQLFRGYYTTFEAKALTSTSNAFSTEVFKGNPLVAIQHDGDLSKIEDNTKLNSLISHEEMTLNEKYKPSYTSRINSFLFMGTNKPVKITDAKSGIIRRLIDVRPSGRRIPTKRYHTLMMQIGFELGGIAHHCVEVYRELGKDYYSEYRPVEMILQTDVFFNFVESAYYVFKEQDGVSLNQAYDVYKTYCDESLVEFKLPRYKFRDELKNYFDKFHEVIRIDGKQIRSYYTGFQSEKFISTVSLLEEHPFSLVLDQEESLFDELAASYPAQAASENDLPRFKWSTVKTVLSDIDTTKTHFVKVPENHIVIDFDLVDENGNKSFELNLQAASKFPPTYAEFSKSGQGVHLHYIYGGDDLTRLALEYSPGIEIKRYSGDSSLRRRLSKCNNIPLATISSGLPLKEEKRVLNQEVIKSEVGLRALITRNLNKEIHPSTKPSIDFIYKILDDAYSSGMIYDVTDMRQSVLIFASKSTNNAGYCLKLVDKMKFASETESKTIENYADDRLVIFDVEVFPNLFVVCWKYEHADQVVRMINPTSQEIEALLQMKLVGFNCRKYDNHILYARYIGYSVEQLFKLSQKIINQNTGLFREAYGLSYADIYEYSSLKQSLKVFEIQLDLHHKELGIPWDEPVPDDLIDEVVEYCVNDVIATEAVHHSRKEDFTARHILADLSGLAINDSTQRHTAQIVFGSNKKPQDQFVYTDLSQMFPGYEYKFGKSTYKGVEVGEGGLVRAKPGMYRNVALLDVASMHPTSIELLNLFGPYTKNFSDLKEARLAIKRNDISFAKTLLNGKLEKYLTDGSDLKSLSYALKIVINIVYGLTSAKFDNPFRDPRNVDNIVAKRGALFMVDLEEFVESKGYTVAHIKTDSVKIPDADDYIIQEVMKFGAKYGYTFEHETTYDRMCLVNDAVYIAHDNDGWHAVGAQFAHPFVFKTLFSKEQIVFKDLVETKSVTTALYLDFNENLSEGAHDYVFVGRVGAFCPMESGSGGGVLLRKKEDAYHAATGTKNFRWMEAEMVQLLGLENKIDMAYFDRLVRESIETIEKFGDFSIFTNIEKEG